MAVILAGGLGTRLRPLTLTRPKPLLPILDKPMIEYLLSSLPKEVDRVLMTVSYMGEAFRAYFESRPRSAYEVTVVNEVPPLGTGGAIKNVEKQVDGTFLVFNGDVICSLDVHKLLEYHHRKRGIGTISLWRTDDVSRYGVVELDEQMRVHQFREKVPKERAQSDLINAGAYVLEPDILEYMESGKVTSIEREVFPCVIKRGLYGFRFDGQWVDAGTPASFIEAQWLALKSRGTTVAADLDDVKLIEPVHISKGCRVGPGSTVGPNVFLGKGVVLGKDCVVSNSSIDEGSEIGAGATIAHSIIGLGAKVPASAKFEKIVLGDKEHFKA